MIISTGMRTDIPAFYSKWFINRIRAGFVYTRNPYNERAVTKYLLTPDVVDCICFCTKNPKPMLKFLDELSNFKMFWFVTITPYGKDIEPNVPLKRDVVSAFRFLSNKLGVDCVGWRYDPVFYSDEWTKQKHIAAFTQLCKALSGYTKFCVVSVLDIYEKTRKNAPNLRELTKDEQLDLFGEFARISAQYGIVLKGCYEGQFLNSVGVDCSGCQTKEMLEKVVGTSLNVPSKSNSRGKCECILGNDIGAYNSCGHLCSYCYANSDKNLVLKNMKKHDDNSPFLIGNFQTGDKIMVAKQKSFKNKQICFEI